MFFKQKSNVIFRNYESFGYITDNRNFGYKQTDNNENVIGDKILSEIGATFLSVLGRKPQTLDELAKKIKELKDKKIYPTFDKDTTDGKQIYKIRLGPYKTLKEAKSIIPKL